MTKRKKRPQLPPEIEKGTRIQYRDRDGKVRTERIHAVGKTGVTTVNALRQRTRVKIEKIIGYWQKKVKASIKTMIKLKE